LTWAAVAGAITGAGRFIDFYLGPSGRQRAKDPMVEWWVKIDDLQWAYLGRDQALFAVKILDRLFGRRFFSSHRLFAVALATTLTFTFVIVSLLVNRIGVVAWSPFVAPPSLSWLILIMLALDGSFSVTRWVSIIVARLLGAARYISLFGLVLNLVFFPQDQFFLQMPLWFRFEFLYYIVIQPQIDFMYNLAMHGVHLVTPASICASLILRAASAVAPNDVMFHLSDIVNLIPNFTRFALAGVFIGSFLLHPIKRQIMTLWERIIDSEKPFTLLSAGLAGAITLLHVLFC
jgi:hypothetical protein